MSSSKTEQRSQSKTPIEEVVERISRESAELRRKFDELIKAIEEDRKKLLTATSGST